MQHFRTCLQEILQNALPELQPDQIHQIVTEVFQGLIGQRPPLITMLDRCSVLLTFYGWMPRKDY